MLGGGIEVAGSLVVCAWALYFVARGKRYDED